MFARTSPASPSKVGFFQKLFRNKTPAVDPKPLLTTASFEPLLKIGEGTSSSVLLVKEKTHGRHLALKVVPHSSGTALNEQSILRQLGGLADPPRTLLPLLASWQDADKSYLLTEWCAGRDLMSILGAGHRLTPEHAKVYAAQLITALESLHRAGIAHCDLKPSNIFLTKDGNIALGDYGRAKSFAAPPPMFGGDEPDYVSFDVDPDATSGSFLQPSEECLRGHSTERGGTPYWSSPAQHAGLPYSFDADIWSLGLLIYRMATGRMPFGNRAKNAVEIKAAYAMEEIEFRDVDGLDEDIKDLVSRLLMKDGDDRPHILQVKDHPYFTGLDWTAVARHEAPVPWAPAKPYIPTVLRPKLLPPAQPCAFDGHVREFYHVSSKLSAPPPGPVKRVVKKVRKLATTQVGKCKVGTRGAAIKSRGLLSRVFEFFHTVGSAGQERGHVEKAGKTRKIEEDEDLCKIDLGVGNVRSSGPSLSARIGVFFRRRWYAKAKTVDFLRKIELD